MKDIEELKILFAEVLTQLTGNQDWKLNEDLIDTPSRVAKMYLHFFRGYDNEQIKEIMDKTFPTNNSQMVIVDNLQCNSICPHHLMPIEYNISVGYIPKGRALGLSKFGRLVTLLSGKPALQENFTSEISRVIQEYLSPQGSIVVVRGIHGCMKFRGIEQHSQTTTSSVTGIFETDKGAKAEFLNLIN